MEPPEQVIRRQAASLRAVAQTGLAYSGDEFDHERYRAIRTAADALMELVTAEPLPAELDRTTVADAGYATPKVDVRAAVFDEGERVLLVQERSDQRWSLPGGWCDVGESPGQAACREVLEEAGVVVRATRLAAVLDRESRGHWPPMAAHVYKLFFLCERTGAPDRNAEPLETLDVGWFALEALPELSTSRITEEELHLLRDAHRDPSRPAVFD
ncbi:NUDIX hydrolase N-terminal domain-containing protein [Saccharopolyspora sp. CA-218241]|uniref:NUDIX hydrolase n=1 Tax=Saccharopolyspora sp. CA-218241 TaxID=3240027 RepID=UPI003D99AF2C